MQPENKSDILLRLDEIKPLIANNNPESDSLSVLTEKYPLGFALFYYDGARHFISQSNQTPDVGFDPTKIQVMAITNTQLFITGFPMRIRNFKSVENTIVVYSKRGTVTDVLEANVVFVEVVSFGVAAGDAAWLVGLRPQ